MCFPYTAFDAPLDALLDLRFKQAPQPWEAFLMGFGIFECLLERACVFR